MLSEQNSLFARTKSICYQGVRPVKKLRTNFEEIIKIVGEGFPKDAKSPKVIQIVKPLKDVQSLQITVPCCSKWQVEGYEMVLIY